MTGKAKGPITASELMADPKVRAHREASLKRIREAEAFERSETAVLRAELADAGVSIDLVWDLVNSKESFPSAIPILLKHLQMPYDNRTREGIARALTDKAARPYAKELIKLFKAEPTAGTHEEVKWVIGNALTVVAGAKYLDEIIALASDPTHGPARSSLLPTHARSKEPQAREALFRMLSDPDSPVRRAALRYVKKMSGEGISRA